MVTFKGVPGIVGTVTTICEALGVPTIVAGVPAKLTETVPTLKLEPKSVTDVPAGPSLGLNWFGDAANIGAGGAKTIKPPVLTMEPPAVWTVSLTPGAATGAMFGTATTIWFAVGVPTNVAAVAPKSTETGFKLKLLPNNVIFAPGDPNFGLNSFGAGIKLGSNRRRSIRASLC